MKILEHISQMMSDVEPLQIVQWISCLLTILRNVINIWQGRKKKDTCE